MADAARRRLRLDRGGGARGANPETHVLQDRGHPKAWLKAAGYWVRGKAGESEKFAD